MRARTRCQLAVFLASGVAIAHGAASEYEIAPWWVRIPLAIAGYVLAYRLVDRSHRVGRPRIIIAREDRS